MATGERQQGFSSRTRFALVITLVAVILPLIFSSGAFGALKINLSLFTNPDLERGLVGHWAFDGEHVKPQTGAFDVSTASFVDSFSVAAQETTPTGLAFSTDGTTMFTVGAVGDSVYEYTLATSFDVSTASFVDSFSVAAQEAFPTDLAFNTDGTTMFVLGAGGDRVYEYTLTMGFDVSTASFVDSFSVAAQETAPGGLAFSTDGTTMFVVGNSGDSVYEYTLTMGFDVSTASFVDSFSVAAQEAVPLGLAFSSDGTTMFVAGLIGAGVNEYTLTTSFDASTASFVDSFSVAAQETVPRGLVFNTDGTTMFVVGDSGDSVYEYQLGTPFTAEDRSTSGNDGVGKGGVTPAVGRLGQAIRFDGIDDYIDVGAASSGVQTIAFWMKAATTTANMNIIDINGVDRIELDGSSNVVASGFPSATVYVDGLSASAHVADTGWHHVVITDTTGVNASAFAIGRVEGGGSFGGTLDDVRLYDRVLLADEIERLYGLGATTKINRTLTTNPELERGLVGHWTFDGEQVQASTGGFDISTASFVDSFSVAAQEAFSAGVAFSTDGTTMFVLGVGGRDVNEYTLSTGFDVSTASFVDSFSVAAQETIPQGLAFSTDGTRMFVAGLGGRDVNEYALSTGFDVSTASFVDSFSVAAQETVPRGLAFSSDGTTMFVVGNSGDSVNEYTLTTGFDISTASFVDSFSVGAQDGSPWDLAFNTDGTAMFVVGTNGDRVYEYTLTMGFDVSTASFVDSFSVGAQESDPWGLAFNTDGTAMFVVGPSGDSVYEYMLSTSLSVEDRSPNQNSGIGSGGVTPAIGRLGQALKFDGIDDYIDVGAASSRVQTIAFWMKAATTTANMNIIDINGIDRIELDGSSNVLASSFPSATVYVDGSSASAHIADTGWHHVVITDTTGVNASNFDIGRVEGGGSFGGTLDDVRLYDRVLSADEIERLYGLGATTRVNRTITTNPDLEDGLVAHWTFDGKDMDYGVEDRVGGNTGILSGFSSTTTRPGRMGQALRFDGTDDYVSIPHVSTPDELTYSFWINVSSSDTQNPLLSMKTLIRINGGNQVQYFPDIDTTVVTASGLSLLDEWRHIVVTHDSSNNYVIYVDGVSELSGTTVDIDSGVVAGLGSRFGGYNTPGFVDGSMNDVRIYKRALSADEVTRLYQLGQIR